MSEQLNVKNLSDEFISEFFQDEDPSGLCFVTSYCLMIYLLSKQISTEINTGIYLKTIEGNEPLRMSHYWLLLNETGEIIDPTIRQFDITFESSIYVGKIEENYISNKYIIEESLVENWLDQSFLDWKKPFVDITYPLDIAFLKRMICFTLKISSKLYIELITHETPSDNLNNHFALFFEPIFIFLGRWKNGVIRFEIPDEIINSNFKIMMNNALIWYDENFTH